MYSNMKRICLIPLLIMLTSAAMNISSGFRYTKIPYTFYGQTILFSICLFYLIKIIVKNIIKKGQNLVTLLVCIGLMVPEFLLLKDVMLSGKDYFVNFLNNKLYLVYGLKIGKHDVVSSDGIDASFFIAFIFQLVTLISVSLLEMGRREVFVLALPLLMYFLPVAIDTIPNEFFLIAFVAAFLVYICLQYNSTVRSLLFSSIIIGALALCVWHYAPWDSIYESVIKTSDRLNEIVEINKPITGKKEDSMSGIKKGTIDYGNFEKEGMIQYTGKVMLKLFTEKKFEKSGLYLVGRYSSGPDYYSAANEKDIDGRQLYGSFTSYGWEDGVYDNDEAVKKENGIEIRSGIDYNGYYIPVSISRNTAKRLMKLKVRDLTDAVKKNSVNNIMPGRFWHQAMDEESNRYFLGDTEHDAKLREAIHKEITIPMMAKLGEDATLGDVINYLKEFFNNNYNYTLRPGVPLSTADEEVYRFLFGKKYGYCTHFAYAATMIFRDLGLGSRMVMGYAIDGVRMNWGSETNILDNDAHAWMEIYVPDSGWFPMDYTPYGDREGIWDVSEDDKNPNMANEADDNYKGEMATQTPPPAKRGFNIDWSKVLKYSKYILTGFILVTIFVFAIYFIGRRFIKFVRYSKLKRDYKKADNNEKIKILHGRLDVVYSVLGVNWDYTSMENAMEDIDKSAKDILKNDYNEVIKSNIEKYVRISYEAAFNKNPISDEEFSMLIREVKKFVKLLNRHLRHGDKEKIRNSGLSFFLKK